MGVRGSERTDIAAWRARDIRRAGALGELLKRQQSA
jgi:hypothetical protein